MAANRKLFLFVVYSVIIYGLISILAASVHSRWIPLNRINLISDIIRKDSSDLRDTTSSIPPVVIENKVDKEFALYHRSRYITNFNKDTTQASLQNFVKKLHDLKTGKKRKIRIAYFGDSMIEGDLLTQTLRKLLQETFGGSGVGFVPITSQVSKFRQSVSDNYSGGWEDENFKTAGGNRLFLSGHLFRSNGDWVQMADQTIKDSAAIIEKSLLCGDVAEPVTIQVNNTPTTIRAENIFNRIVMDKGRQRNITVTVSDQRLPVYGISFESDSGVFVDNFSFRGITGIEFARIDSSFLRAIDENNPYDLVIFQYGVNLLFRPNDKNFNWYARALLPVVRKFRNCFPNSEFLVVSTADRAFRYGGEYQSAIGIDSLVKVQAVLAYETGSGFYNQFESMGGTNSIVEWANRNPSLANRDYVHPNHRGAEVLGKYFFEAIMNEYNKYIRRLK
jgi:hypothetical protein